MILHARISETREKQAPIHRPLCTIVVRHRRWAVLETHEVGSLSTPTSSSTLADPRSHDPREFVLFDAMVYW